MRLLEEKISTASLPFAKITACLKDANLQPLISKRIWPARTEATQYLTDPFPLPIRTSSGFLVTGKFGNTRVQILACFLRLRRNKRLTDSI
jgi:hypothetical protein